MNDVEMYPFVERDAGTGTASLAPLLPLTLIGPNSKNVQVHGLLDTGATVNVLPYSIGIESGAEWDRQTTPVTLGGNLSRCDARALILPVVVGAFSPSRLVFTWARSDDVPLLLGQVNFFMEFDVCFFRSRSLFELRPRAISDQRG